MGEFAVVVLVALFELTVRGTRAAEAAFLAAFGFEMFLEPEIAAFGLEQATPSSSTWFIIMRQKRS